MATLKYEGNEIPVAEDWRLKELIEAENALGQDMTEARGGGKMALILYISIRRAEPTLPINALANKVLNMDITALGDDEDQENGDGPLEDDDQGNGSEETLATDEQQTGGRQPSGSLA